MGKPLNLVRVHQYTGYQLYATAKYTGESSDVCMRYIIAVVLDWVRNRMGLKNVPLKLAFPSPEEAAFDVDVDLPQYHENSGYMIHISSIKEKGYWAISVHEPDSDRDNRPALAGRTIITDIALHILNDESVELGIKTTIQDPEDKPELPSSFRPAIVRSLILAKPIELFHIEPIQYRKVKFLKNKQDMEKFNKMMNNPDQCLPAVVFTYENQSIQDMVGEKEASLKTQSLYGAFAALIDKKELSGIIDKKLPSLPFDVDEFAHLTYGYGWTYLVDKNSFGLLSDRFNKKLNPGDVIFIEPLRFNDGEYKIYQIADCPGRKERDNLFQELEEKVLYYSKRKDVDYHGVLFERNVRDLVQESKITKEIKADLDKEFLDEINKLIDDRDQLKAAKDYLEIEKEVLSEENTLLKQKRQEDGTGTWVAVPNDITEVYKDEIKDLLIDAMRISYRNCSDKRTRKKVLLEKLLENNTFSGKGKQKFMKAKTILLEDPDLKEESSKSALKKIGFEVEKMEGGHKKIYLSVDDSCFVTVSSTTSNRRGSCTGNNAAAWLVKQFSVCSEE